MSDKIGVETTTTVFLSIDKIVKEMDAEDIGSFCSAIALRLDQEYAGRADAASQFASGLSEIGCRFIAEALASHYMR